MDQRIKSEYTDTAPPGAKRRRVEERLNQEGLSRNLEKVKDDFVFQAENLTLEEGEVMLPFKPQKHVKWEGRKGPDNHVLESKSPNPGQDLNWFTTATGRPHNLAFRMKVAADKPSLDACLATIRQKVIDTDNYQRNRGLSPLSGHLQLTVEMETKEISDARTQPLRRSDTHLEFKDCANCGNSTHQLKDCVIAESDGWMDGCPKCNTRNHSVDACPLLQQMSIKMRLMNIKELVLLGRQNKPPFRSNMNWDILQAALLPERERDPDTATIGNELVDGRAVWTSDHTMRVQQMTREELAEGGWVSLDDYREGEHDSSKLPKDPKTANLTWIQFHQAVQRGEIQQMVGTKGTARANREKEHDNFVRSALIKALEKLHALGPDGHIRTPGEVKIVTARVPAIKQEPTDESETVMSGIPVAPATLLPRQGQAGPKDLTWYNSGAHNAVLKYLAGDVTIENHDNSPFELSVVQMIHARKRKETAMTAAQFANVKREDHY